MITELLEAEYAIAINRKISVAAEIGSAQDTTIVDKSCALFDMLPEDFDFSTQLQVVKQNGFSFLIHSKQIHNFDGTLAGYYLTSNNITDMQKNFKSFITYIVSATILIIFLSSFVLYKGFGTILKTIEDINVNLEETIDQRTKELNTAKNNAIEQNKVIGSLYKRFKSMFQNHHSIMFLVDPTDGAIVDANSAALEFVELDDKKTLFDLSIADINLLPPKEDTIKILKRAKTEGLKKITVRNSLSTKPYWI